MEFKIVVLGGGGGGSSILNALKKLFYESKIKSLVGLISTADDGGSTGILKKEYNTSAWGDIGKNILALVDTRKKELDSFKSCLSYRFDEGILKGHTVRNIVMTAFSLLSNYEDDCVIKELSKLLQIDQNLKIFPITDRPTSCSLIFDDEKMIDGQNNITMFPIQNYNSKHKIFLKPNNVKLNSNAKIEIAKCDFIIIAPGHFYGTILPVLSTPTLDKELKNKKIIIIMPFFNNIKINHTNNWRTSDYFKVYKKYLNRDPDYVICNNKYNENIKNHEWIVDDKPKTNAVWISKNLLPNKIKEKEISKADKIVRSPMGFDSNKMNKILLNIFNKL